MRGGWHTETMCQTSTVYRTECDLCGRGIDLPFPARTPKRCDACADPRPLNRRGGWCGPGPDEDANGGWANVVAALEEDR